MKKFKTYLLAAIGLVILVGALVLLTPLAGQGQKGGGPPGGMNVKVVNSDSEPVPVNCIQSLEPFQETVILSFSPGDNGEFGGFIVTPGKRLVIEHVSVSAGLTQGQRLFVTKITTLQVLGGFQKEHFLVTEFQGSRPGIGDYYAASQPMRLYAVGAVSIGAFRTDTVGSSQVNVSVSGYLIDY